MIPRPPISTLFPYTTLFPISLLMTCLTSLAEAFILAGDRTQALDHLERAERWVKDQRSWSANMELDRKSTRLNSSHQIISYAVFCLKKKKKNKRYKCRIPTRR